jgi:hypothetical protein
LVGTLDARRAGGGGEVGVWLEHRRAMSETVVVVAE